MARVRPSVGPAQLAWPFAAVGAMTLALLGTSAISPLPLCFALLGAIVSRHARRIFALTLCGCVIAANLVSGAPAAILTPVAGWHFSGVVGDWHLMDYALLGTAAYVPIVFVVYQAQFVGRARTGSLVDGSDRRSVWFPVFAFGVAASSWQAAFPWLGPPSVAGLLLLAALDLRALCRVHRARGAGASVDLGLGEDRFVITEAPPHPHRDPPIPSVIVLGSIGACAKVLRRRVGLQLAALALCPWCVHW